MRRTNDFVVEGKAILVAGWLAAISAASCRGSRPRPEQGRKMVLCDNPGAGSKGHETRPTLMAHTHMARSVHTDLKIKGQLHFFITRSTRARPYKVCWQRGPLRHLLRSWHTIAYPIVHRHNIYGADRAGGMLPSFIPPGPPPRPFEYSSCRLRALCSSTSTLCEHFPPKLLSSHVERRWISSLH